MQTLSNEDVLELGSEWMGLQALQELGIDRHLRSLDWDEESIQLALIHIVSRAVYPGSELKTARFLKENSSICESTGYRAKRISKDKLYELSKRLYKEKNRLELYLSNKTNDLFDLEDTIILYDLTNTYFEGSNNNNKNLMPYLIIITAINVYFFEIRQYITISLLSIVCLTLYHIVFGNILNF